MAKHGITKGTKQSQRVRNIGGRVVGEALNARGHTMDPSKTRITIRQRGGQHRRDNGK